MSVSSARYELLIIDLRRILREMESAVKNGTATYKQLCNSRDIMKEKHKHAKEMKSFFYISFFKDKKVEGIVKKADKLIEKFASTPRN